MSSCLLVLLPCRFVMSFADLLCHLVYLSCRLVYLVDKMTWQVNKTSLVLSSCQFVVLSCLLVMSSCLLVLSSQLLVLSSSRFFVSSCLLVLSSCQFVMSSCLLGSISSRCSGKWAHTYPPKKWLDKDCRRNYHIKTESPSLIHRMAKWFRRRGDTRRNSRVLKEHDVLFDCLLWTFLLMIVVGEI